MIGLIPSLKLSSKPCIRLHQNACIKRLFFLEQSLDASGL
nr:MAG TPA: hypothetical protein [Caudoviricetes sp.]